METRVQFDPSLPWRDIRGEGFNIYIGPIQVAKLDGDELRFALRLDDRHMNSSSVCHGGVLMSVADSGLGTCAWYAAGENPVATIDFEADFLAAAKNGQMLHGVARVIRKAREFLFMEGDLWSGERQVMRCSGIWVVRSTGRTRDGS